MTDTLLNCSTTCPKCSDDIQTLCDNPQPFEGDDHLKCYEIRGQTELTDCAGRQAGNNRVRAKCWFGSRQQP